MPAPALIDGGGDVLLLSMRRVHDLVAFCAPYEFEDVVRSVTGADRVELNDYAAVESARRAYRMARGLGLARGPSLSLARPRERLRLTRRYELFLPVFNNPFELYALSAIEGWRERCRVACCFVSESWLFDLPGYLLETLAAFDHVFLATQNSVAEYARRSGRPTTFLPLAADVVTFAPREGDGERVINVLNIGRRSAVTHAALVARARNGGFFYHFDTVAASGADPRQRTFRVADAAEHRLLLASLLRHSRTYVANRARVNENEAAAALDEISGRFYEGAAAGAVLVGDAPRSDEFRRQFDWPDAVVPLPFDSPDVVEHLEALESNPSRVARIRADNVRNVAERHDWLNRLETVFQVAGLEPTLGMRERRRSLAAIAVAGHATLPA